MKFPKEKTRIMLFGTFDFLHKGHLHFFKQARKLAKNPYLIVSIARDVNVKKIKGKKSVLPELKRAQAVKKLKIVDKVVLGGIKSFLPHIIREHPHIIALGYDQAAYTDNLRENLNKLGLNVKVKKLRPHKPHLYKSSLIKIKNKKV